MKHENYFRNCPICGKLITYKTIYSKLNAERDGRKCKSCGIKSAITDEVKEKMRQRVLGEKNPMHGRIKELNPFYGKKHTTESIEKILKNRNYDVYRTKEFREKISKLTSGENGPMYGRTVYSVWVEKFGIEIANKKMDEYRIKQSLNTRGEKNPMYGKPSPSGSGNGWSGWYKNWFFRSFRELSYMINIIEKYNIKWSNAETKKLLIHYKDYKNNSRTYFADFLLENKYLIEIKPKKLWNSDSVLRKKQAAVQFCNNNNLIYKLRDIPILTTEEIHNLYITNQIKLTDRYDKKYKEKFLN